MTLKNGEEEGVVFLLEGNDCKRSGLIFFFFLAGTKQGEARFTRQAIFE